MIDVLELSGQAVAMNAIADMKLWKREDEATPLKETELEEEDEDEEEDELEDDGIVVPAIAVNVPGPQELGIVVPGQENVEVVTEATPVLIAKVDPAPEVSDSESVAENKPDEETNPVADISSVDESTALAETTTVVAITTPVADSKPTTETKPVIENKPVAELKPVAETEPSTANQPAAQESETKHLPIVPIAATTFTAIAAAGILIAYKKKNEGEKYHSSNEIVKKLEKEDTIFEQDIPEWKETLNDHLTDLKNIFKYVFYLFICAIPIVLIQRCNDQ